MDTTITNITIDLATSNNFGIVKAVQGDMRTRFVRITLLDNQVEYDFSKVYPVLRGTKPDGTTIFNTCSVSEDNKIIVELTDQILAEPGMSIYEISLYSTLRSLDDEKQVITSFPFTIFVNKAAFDPRAITSTDEFTAIAEVIGNGAILKDCLSEIITSKEAAKVSETNAKNSEIASKASETKSKTSETNAKTSETNAKNSEIASKASETKSKTSETNAATSAKSAENNYLLSKSYAVGTNNITRPNDTTDNAKYYSEQAKKQADLSTVSATNSANSATTATQKSNAAANSAASAKISETNSSNNASAAKISEDNAENSKIAAFVSSTNASNAASIAETKANEAEDYYLLSKSYAIGTGNTVRNNDETDNSEYYCRQSNVYRNETQEMLNLAKDIMSQVNQKLEIAEFDIDDEGWLIYSLGSEYAFMIDDDGNLLWEVL